MGNSGVRDGRAWWPWRPCRRLRNLVHGGEGDGQKACVAHIVHAHDANVFGDADSEGKERLHETRGVRSLAQTMPPGRAESSMRRMNAWSNGLPRHAALPIRLDGMKAKGFVESGNAGIDGVGGIFFAEKDDAADAMVDKVPRSEITSTAIVDSDEVVRRTLGPGQVSSDREALAESAHDRERGRCGDWRRLCRW